VNVTVRTDESWSATAHPSGSVVALNYVCPTCGRHYEIRVQSPPWHELSDAKLARFAGADGHLLDGFRGFEERRVAGELKHREVTEMTTQLWCHLCQKGVDAALTAG